MPDVNKEKLKSINYWLRKYMLFNNDEEWLLQHIRDILDSDEWHCMDEHVEGALLHERQIAYLLIEQKDIPELYKPKGG